LATALSLAAFYSHTLTAVTSMFFPMVFLLEAAFF
jgi:hypothetical protein